MNIGIIGRIAEGVELVDGQTIKTKILLNELKNIYPEATYNIADSYNSKKKLISYLSQVRKCLKNSDVVFVLLSRNGIKITFPYIYLLNKNYKKPIIHDVIGGCLDELAKENPITLKCIKSFYINMVESNGLAKRLHEIGVKNVAVIPNFKRVDIIKENEFSDINSAAFKFCTFSRVSKAKGISEAILAINDINKKNVANKVKLDIYGPIEADYVDEFNQLLSVSDKAINYRGCVDYSKSVDILKEYSALLFPTTFYGEGFPGTIIDAFSAGIPVIATDWHCNPEIIEDGYSGFLYPSSKPEMLKCKIEEFMSRPEIIPIMKVNCTLKAKEYQADLVMKKVVDIMNCAIYELSNIVK